MGVKHEEVLGQTSFILHIDVILCQSMIIEREKMVKQKKSKRKIQKISKNSAKIQMGKCRSRKNAGTPYKWEEPAGMSRRPSMKKCIKVWYLVTDNRIREKCDESLESL